MEREIKFRALDAAYNKMYHSDEYITRADPTGLSAFFMVHRNDEMQQFTGLRDKNGKEIYEGDVVEEGTVIFNKDESRKLIVEFRESEACFSFKEIPNSAALCVYAKYCDVIGNIHENPDLLRSAIGIEADTK